MSKRIATFAERLIEVMNEKEIKAADLARRSGVSESMISSYRAGRFEASQVNLQKLAEALDISIAYLMGYEVPQGRYAEPKSKTEVLAAKLERLSPEQLDIVEALIDNMKPL